MVARGRASAGWPGTRDRAAPPDDEQLVGKRSELSVWPKTKKLKEGDYWNQLLFDIVRDLPWRDLGVDPWLQQRLFTGNTVILEGTSRVSRRHFVVPCEPW